MGRATSLLRRTTPSFKIDLVEKILILSQHARSRVSKCSQTTNEINLEQSPLYG